MRSLHEMRRRHLIVRGQTSLRAATTSNDSRSNEQVSTTTTSHATYTHQHSSIYSPIRTNASSIVCVCVWIDASYVRRCAQVLPHLPRRLLLLLPLLLLLLQVRCSALAHAGIRGAWTRAGVLGSADARTFLCWVLLARVGADVLAAVLAKLDAVQKTADETKEAVSHKRRDVAMSGIDSDSWKEVEASGFKLVPEDWPAALSNKLMADAPAAGAGAAADVPFQWTEANENQQAAE